eukprot:3525787-Prymnesium_polylepis.1
MLSCDLRQRRRATIDGTTISRDLIARLEFPHDHLPRKREHMQTSKQRKGAEYGAGGESGAGDSENEAAAWC